MNNRIFQPFSALFLICAFTFCASPPPAETHKIQIGKSLSNLTAAVSCAHPEAARIGTDILAQAGHAVDAAIAMQWALAVCYPEAGNIGGGGFMVVRLNDGSSHSLDYREKAPDAALENMFQDAQGFIIPGKSTDTHFGSGIPGTVKGLYEAHKKFGKLPMAELLKPAIVLAENGFAITAIQAENLNEHQSVFRERNKSENVFSVSKNWTSGDLLIQPELAETLKRILESGADGFYKGLTAQLIVEEMAHADGLITMEDLAGYEAIWRKPILHPFGKYQIISMPPPSSGGIALAQLLSLYEHCINDSLEHNSVDYIHAVVEMQRRVYADRSEHLGDPDFYEVPVELLLDKDYLYHRMDDFRWDQATASSAIKPGVVNVAESMETTHLSVVDSEGNAVSATTTINNSYGSKIVVTGAGFLLNNEMDDFSSKPGEPNMFGLIGGGANAIAPRKRMLSSMTPTIVEKDGKLFLVAGSPGGSTIITSVFQTVMNTTVFGMNLEDAVAAPKFHSQWLPDTIFFEEGRFQDTLINKLNQRNHQTVAIPSLGRVDAILVSPDGMLQAVGDPRSDDTAGGY